MLNQTFLLFYSTDENGKQLDLNGRVEFQVNGAKVDVCSTSQLSMFEDLLEDSVNLNPPGTYCFKVTKMTTMGMLKTSLKRVCDDCDYDLLRNTFKLAALTYTIGEDMDMQPMLMPKLT